jgi:hypothetical protein
MIKNITSNSSLINVNCYQGNNPYISPGAQSAGMVRYNTSMQRTEVYDGNNWQELGGGYASIDLAPHVQSAINWVMAQMAKESEMKSLAAKHASVAHALENVEQAKRELELIYQLTKDHTNGTATTV